MSQLGNLKRRKFILKNRLYENAVLSKDLEGFLNKLFLVREIKSAATVRKN